MCDRTLPQSPPFGGDSPLCKGAKAPIQPSAKRKFAHLRQGQGMGI